MVLEPTDVKLYFQFCKPQCAIDLNFYLTEDNSLVMNNHFKRKIAKRKYAYRNYFFLVTKLIHICSWIFRKHEEKEKMKSTEKIKSPKRSSLCTL